MSGLSVTYTGTVTKQAEIRTRDGQTILFFDTVADGPRLEGEAEAKIKVACFGDDLAALAPRLVKHAEVYVEGRLILRELNGGRTELGVWSSRVDVLGQRGRVIGQIGRARE